MANFKFYIVRCWPLGILLVSAIAGFYYYLGFSGDLDLKMETAKLELAGAVSEMALSQMRMDDFKIACGNLRNMSDGIFPESEPQKLIDKMKHAAGDFDITLVDIEIDVPKYITARDAREMVSMMKFRADFEGGYYSIGKFLMALEKSPFLENIDEMAISPGTRSADNIRTTFRGALRVFDDKLINWLSENGT